jgi:hypothetical protein
MLVFVDESGDAGMKLGAGSSNVFVVTAVIFEDHDEANACDLRIDLMREELRLSPHFEFHFNKCSRAFRNQFLEKVAPFNFFYLAVVVDKPKLQSPGLSREGIARPVCFGAPVSGSEALPQERHHRG